MNDMKEVFLQWQTEITRKLKPLKPGLKPKVLIDDLSEFLLVTYTGKALINCYDVYQHLMNYWFETMQDDCYLIAADGWQAETYRILEKNKKGKDVDKGWTCDLIPKALIVNRYFADEKEAIDNLNSELESIISQKIEMEEEHSGEEGAFTDLDKVNKGNIQKLLKSDDGDLTADDVSILKQYLKLLSQESDTKKAVKAAETELDTNLLNFYPTLTQHQVKELVVDDKWMTTIANDISSEMDRISQRLTSRIKELAQRYETPVAAQTQQVAAQEEAVNEHLRKMGYEL